MKKTRKGVKSREPNGRPQRERHDSPTEVRRLRDAALSGMRDPEWGTELGRLFLVGKVTPEEFAAGKRWAKLSAAYSIALQSPAPDPQAMNPEGGGQTCPPDPDSHEGRAEAERHRRAKEAYLTADAALLLLGSPRHRAVKMVCDRNQPLSDYQQLLDLKAGLFGLSERWNLTSVSKSPNVR